MPRSPLACTLAALAFAVCALPAAAQERTWSVQAALPLAIVGGHTSYDIHAADATGSVESELEFPLGGAVTGLQLEIATRSAPGEGRLIFQLSGLTSIAGPSGTLRDSDWLDGQLEVDEVGAPHPGKDIYSESHAELDAKVFEGRLLLEVNPRSAVVLAPMAGVLYQRFHYDVRDADQVGYGPWNTVDYTGYVPGRVLDYRVSYWAPYVGARAAVARGRLSAAADLWFSPSASASDRDDHLVRSKLSTTSASGTAWQGSLAARLALGERDSLQAQASLLRIEATGTQHQRFYAGPYSGEEGDIDAKITSSRTTFFLVWAHQLSR